MRFNDYDPAYLDELIDNHTMEPLLDNVEMKIGKNPEFAKALLRRVMMKRPRTARAYMLMGDIYLGVESDLDMAEKFYCDAMDIEPSAGCYSSMAMVFHERGDSRNAEECYTTALSMNRQPREMYELAAFYIDTGKLSESIMLLKGAKSMLEDRLKKDMDVHNRQFYTFICLTLADAYGQKGDLKNSNKEKAELDRSPYRLMHNVDRRT